MTCPVIAPTKNVHSAGNRAFRGEAPIGQGKTPGRPRGTGLTYDPEPARTGFERTAWGIPLWLLATAGIAFLVYNYGDRFAPRAV